MLVESCGSTLTVTKATIPSSTVVLVVVVEMLWLNVNSNRGYSTSVLHAIVLLLLFKCSGTILAVAVAQ